MRPPIHHRHPCNNSSPGYSHGLEGLAEPGFERLEVFNDHLRNHPPRPRGRSHSCARPGRRRRRRRPLLRAPSAWAAVGGAGGRFPRAAVGEHLGGAAAGHAPTGYPELPLLRTPAQAEAATVCRALPPAPLPSESSRRRAERAQTRTFLSALGLGACWQRGRAEVKKAKTKGSSMGTVRGSSRLPAPPRRWLPINLARIN